MRKFNIEAGIAGSGRTRVLMNLPSRESHHLAALAVAWAPLLREVRRVVGCELTENDAAALITYVKVRRGAIPKPRGGSPRG